jgi:NADPH:quinone reductase-like Zn-dependent oxidoreductase
VTGVLSNLSARDVTGRAKIVGAGKRSGSQNLLLLKELIEARKVRTVIERRHSLAEIAEAHRHAEGGHKKGHVLVVIEQSGRPD